MHGLRPGLISASLLSSCLCLAQSKSSTPEQLPSADSVMNRVAVNQDAAEAERAHYVYVQHAKMTSRHGKTIMCEEITDYRVTPSTDSTHEQLLKVDGRFLKNQKYRTYSTLLPRDEDKPKDAGKDLDKSEQKDKDKSEQKEKKGKDLDPVFDPNSDETLDRDLVENMRWNLIHDKSKDGVNAHLFPLTSKDQINYTFRMIGRERLNDRDVFHITFRPKDKNDFGWSGDAYIDTEAFQPVLVTTGMARKIPFAVRTFLGTNLPGLGFTVTYAPQPDGVWFPVTFSTEFKIHVLFFFNREVILNAENREFEKTHVTSRIVGDATPVPPDEP
ncbi:MAG TPA: hypothetical protein VKB47_01560 [Terracidiphilus sp.]|nr:hypothetical protein [Terracidiphilus sp.]